MFGSAHAPPEELRRGLTPAGRLNAKFVPKCASVIFEDRDHSSDVTRSIRQRQTGDTLRNSGLNQPSRFVLGYLAVCMGIEHTGILWKLTQNLQKYLNSASHPKGVFPHAARPSPLGRGL
jgi:hypothetical protein